MDTVVSVFQPPEWRDQGRLLLQTPGLRCFGPGAPGNEPGGLTGLEQSAHCSWHSGAASLPWDGAFWVLAGHEDSSHL